jgi:hypothetical protein
VVGKPAEFMLANIADKFGLQRGQICMVGDRLDTDILFGKNGGLTTMLVLSGGCLCSVRACILLSLQCLLWIGLMSAGLCCLWGRRGWALQAGHNCSGAFLLLRLLSRRG